MRNRDYSTNVQKPLRHKVIGKAATHRKTGPLRVRFKFVGAGADYHLPEGNTASVSIAIWEDRQPIASSNKLNMAASMSRNNQEARMPAMRASQEARPRNDVPHNDGINQKFQRCAFETRKSRKTCTRATDFSSSG